MGNVYISVNVSITPENIVSKTQLEKKMGTLPTTLKVKSILSDNSCTDYGQDVLIIYETSEEFHSFRIDSDDLRRALDACNV